MPKVDLQLAADVVQLLLRDHRPVRRERPLLPLQVQRGMDHLLHYGVGNPPALEFLHDGHAGMLVECLPQVVNHQNRRREAADVGG